MRDALHGHRQTPGRKLSNRWLDRWVMLWLLQLLLRNVRGTAARGELPRRGMDHQLEKLMRS